MLEYPFKESDQKQEKRADLPLRFHKVADYALSPLLF